MPLATQYDVDGLSATAFDLAEIQPDVTQSDNPSTAMPSNSMPSNSMPSNSMMGKLYVSSYPGFSKVDGATEDRKIAHLAFLFDQGIHLVISLTPQDEREKLGAADMPARIQSAGIDWMEVPVVNYGTPDQDQMHAFMTMIDQASARLAHGQKVLVHCRGGTGRAGKVAAIILMGGGMSADLAISTLRDHRAGCVQTQEQEDFVRAYDGHLIR